MNELITARRTLVLPWNNDGRYHEIVSGNRTPSPKFAKSPTAYACMQVRGQELANLPWNIMRDDKIVEDHELIEMLTEFGPESNWGDSMIATEFDLLCMGAAFWFRDVDILKRLNPAKMLVNKSAAGISGFTFDKGGKDEQNFKRDEIIYFREYNLSLIHI